MLTGLYGHGGWLAQGLGSEDWANLLFIVVMAALWLVAGLAKAIGKKKSQQEPQELDSLGEQRPPAGTSWQQRLARRAEELQRRLEQEAGLGQSRRPQPQARKTPAPPAPAPGGKLTIRPGRGGQSVLVYERPQAQPPTPPPEPELARQRQMQEALAAMKDSVGPVVQHASELTPGGLTPLTTEPLQPLSAGAAQTKASRESPGSQSESGTIIDYGDPEALKKAILQYEILGKPLALRETDDPAWFS